MTTPRKIALIVGCIFFAGALAAWLDARHILHRHRWTVLKQPIRLEEGFSLTQSFTVDLPTEYFVKVECRKPASSGAENAFLSEELVVSFSVAEGEPQLADGDSSTHGGADYTEDYISRVVGSFQATPGHTYTLSLRVTHSLPQLAGTSAAVKVSVTPIDFKNAFVSASISAYLAMGLAIVGLMCTTPVLCSLLSRRRRESSRSN